MPFYETPIKDLIVFEPQVFGDSRGYFYESFNAKTFADVGIENTFVQDNQSYSAYGVLRGIHFQKGGAAQAKLVRALVGKVWDVAVDLRPNSKTFGKHFGIELSDINRKQLYIPRGFGHGFVVLSDSAEFFYKCDNFYAKDAEIGVRYNDRELGIDWKIPAEKIIISEKDDYLLTFSEMKSLL